ncbi:hypothetical protein D9611_010216 [Ephemerocybe angulata]|uniref:Uncharacterized protein n=1 Tax=Ephemerocybe angulata TaxID=980116 RepID=A0A8H5AZ65_9AGAR|nr:hypothetical protein D9611_010216 [Tulosesus angulatus]
MTTAIATTQTKVLFPAPPPTTNALTNQQRNQLLRKTKKLEQLLGATPHLLDNSSPPGEPVSPSQLQRRASSSISISRGSFDSFSSVSVTSTCHSGTKLLDQTSSFPSTRRSSLRRPKNNLKKSISAPLPSAPQQSAPSYETWSGIKPPFLRIDSNTNSYPNMPYWAESSSNNTSKRYTLAPSSPDSDSEDQSTKPSFTISCTRKSKMDRLRRKLGHGVPIDLVFPASKNGLDDEDELDAESSSGDEWLLVPPPTPRTSRETKASGTIAGSRDSLIVQQRRSPRSNTSNLPSSPSTESQSPPIAVSSSSSSPRAVGSPLTAIIESPDEHGSGWTEPFGIVRTPSTKSEGSQFDPSEVKRWSTRLGYEGWTSPEPIPKSARRRWSVRPSGIDA